MPEYLKALVVILAVATAVFGVAQPIVCGSLFAPDDFARRRNFWFAVTLTAFLAHNFWLFMFVAAALLHFAASRDRDKVGLVLFLLLAVPQIRGEVPGFGIVNYFFEIDFVRLMSLVILVPLFFQELSRLGWRHFVGEMPDKILFCYLALILGLSSRYSTFTGTLRSAFYFFIEIVVPYLVASRLARDVAFLKSAFASYAVGAAVVAAIGVFEFGKRWLLYQSLDEAMGMRWAWGAFFARGDNVRAMVTSGQPIAFGYAMAVAFALVLGLERAIRHKILWYAALGLIGAGLVASISRGPWLGAAVGAVVFVFTDPQKARAAGRVVMAAAAGLLLLLATPVGEKALEWATVDDPLAYRRRLFDVSLELIMRHPVFGPPDAMNSPAMQELRQGQGIIDVVNTYLSVGLSSGLTGVVLFAGFFLAVLLGVWRQMNATVDKHSEAYDVGRGLLAALSCTVVTIFTVSSITVIPWIYYLLAGLGVGYARLGRVPAGQGARRSAIEEPSTRARSGPPAPLPR